MSSWPEEVIQIRAGEAFLTGDLAVPSKALGVVAFAHGSGSSRLSPRNRHVAAVLQSVGLGTLLVDLLTAQEEPVDAYTALLRFDIDLLATRLGAAAEWVRESPATRHLPVGLFGASTGGAAALVVAARRPEEVQAVVSRGGRPDLVAEEVLRRVQAPTLLIVGERDEVVLELNQAAAAQMNVEHRIEVVPDASHLFQEPGALDQVASLAADWFVQHLSAGRQ